MSIEEAQAALQALHERLAKAKAEGLTLEDFAAKREQTHEQAREAIGAKEGEDLLPAIQRVVGARSASNVCLAQTLDCLDEVLDGAIEATIWLGRHQGRHGMIMPTELRRACAQVAEARRVLAEVLPGDISIEDELPF